jgi:hypothetical protein
VAATLRQERDVQVEVVDGGLSEFTVWLDGARAVTTNRLWYPNTGRVIARMREILQTPRPR